MSRGLLHLFTVVGLMIVQLAFLVALLYSAVVDAHKDLVQPNETHLEGVPFFIQHPKPVYYAMKDHPAIIECTAEPVSHAAIECAEKVIPYKGPDEAGRLKVTRLDSANRPSPDGDRWHLALQVRSKEVEEWFDSYVCRCEAWNKVLALQRPKKVFSKATIVMEAYLDRKFLMEPTSTSLDAGQRLELNCVPPEGKPAPEVFWIKNGTRINSGLFPQVKINDRGQLVIESTVTSDSGNYTCVAELLGLEYRYANAEVRIFDKVNQLEPLNSPYSGAVQVKTLAKHELVSVPDVVTYTSVFLFLTFLLFTLFAFLLAKRKGSISCFIHRLTDRCCVQSKNVYHKQKNGKLAVDPLLLDDYNHGWVGAKTLMDHIINEVPQIGSPRSVSLNVIANRHVSSTAPDQPVTVYETLGPSRCIPKPADRRNSSATCAFPISSTISMFVPLPPPPNSLPPTPVSNQSFEQLDYPPQLTNGYQKRTQEQPCFSSNNSRTTCHPGGSRNSYNPSKLEMRIPPTVSDFALCLNNRSSFDTFGQLSDYQAHSTCISSNPQQMTVKYASKSSPDGKCSTNSTTNTITISSGNEDDSLSERGQIPFARFLDLENRVIPDLGNTEHSTYDIYARPGGHTNGTNKTVCELTDLADGSVKLENSDVTLTIPKDALPSSTSWPVELTVCREDRARPVLTEHQTLLSPIVQYGPQNLELLCPVLLSFPHCADLSRGSWSITLLAAPYLQTKHADDNQAGFVDGDLQRQDSQDNLYGSSSYAVGGENQWKPVSVLHPEEADYEQCRLNLVSIQLLTQRPQRYCLIGERSKQCGPSGPYRLPNSQVPHSSENGQSTYVPVNSHIPQGSSQPTVSRILYAIKLLCIAAFAGPLIPNMDFSVRIYVLPRTKDALIHVKEVESESDGYLLDLADQFPFKDNGRGIVFLLNELSFGWKSRLQMDRQEIPFRHVWSGVQTPLLHCSFSFEPIEPTKSYISCKVAVFQGDPDSEHTVLHLVSDYSK